MINPIQQKDPVFEYKTLLTKQEYVSIATKFSEIKGDTQINYYFDTKRFTLKAMESILRVKRSEKKLVIIFERKKGYNYIRLEQPISEDEFNKMINEGVIENEEINAAVTEIIKDQKVVNFMSLSTFRIYIPYKNTRFALDKCQYVNTTDYEIEFQSKTREGGKVQFVEIIKDYNVSYKKCSSKLKRAYEALRQVL